MVTVGILGILIAFSIGILMQPQKRPEKKKEFFIDFDGPIENADIKKPEDILIR